MVKVAKQHNSFCTENAWGKEPGGGGICVSAYLYLKRKLNFIFKRKGLIKGFPELSGSRKGDEISIMVQ